MKAFDVIDSIRNINDEKIKSVQYATMKMASESRELILW